MTRKKRVTVGAKRVKVDAKPTGKQRRGVTLSHSIAYEPPDADQVSLIATSAIERISGGGLLFQSADKWSPDLDFVDTVRQQALAALGIKIAMLDPFVLQGAVEPSSDGLYHLDVEIDGTVYTIILRYPDDGAGSAINSVVAVTLPPGSEATAVLENGVLTIGIPRGADGENGAGVTNVTVTTLPPGSNATANFNPSTGVLTLGIPRGADGQGVTSAVANTLPPNSNATADFNASTGVLTLGIPRGQGVTSATAIELPAGSQPTANFNTSTGVLTLGIPRAGTISAPPPPPSIAAEKCGAARLYAERAIALSTHYANIFSTGMSAIDFAVQGSQAIASLFGVAVAPPVAIVGQLLSFLTSYTAETVTGYSDAVTLDQVTETVFCLLVNSSSYPRASEIGTAFSAKFSDLKGVWFNALANSIGDDLTARILSIGALDPSNACQLFDCTSLTLCINFQTGENVSDPRIQYGGTVVSGTGLVGANSNPNGVHVFYFPTRAGIWRTLTFNASHTNVPQWFHVRNNTVLAYGNANSQPVNINRQFAAGDRLQLNVSSGNMQTVLRTICFNCEDV